MAISNPLNQVVTSAQQQELIADMYRDQLGREPDTAGLAYYAAELGKGRSAADIEQEINRSLEGQQYDTLAIESAYRQMFGRTAEDLGQQYWMSVAQSNIDAENQALLNYIRGGAQNEDVTALTTNPQGFTNLQLADLVADPSGGRMPTTSIYDVANAQGTNISYINGVPVQFVTNYLGQPVTTNFNQGQFTSGTGEEVLNNKAVSAAINRALNSGAMSGDELKQLQADVKAAKSMDDIYAAFNKPQATIVLDAKYGLQTGQGNTLAEAQTRAADMQKVIDTFTSEYMPSNWSVAQQAQTMGVPYAFGPSAYQGYSTMLGPQDVVTAANFQNKINELNQTIAQGIAGLRPTYRDYQFNRAQPEVVVPETFADRALLGARAPGGVDLAAAAQAAPATFGGVAALPARPATNTSVPEGMAEPTIEGIMANQVAEAAPAVGMKKGGEVPAQGIKSLAQSLPQYGRYNDDMVAHISSEEAALLESLGGAGTINPYTGLPEYGVGSLFQKTVMRPVKSVAKAVVKPFKEVVQKLGPVGQIAGAYFGGPLGAAVVGGLQSEGKFFDVKRGIMSGITAYGAQQLGAGLEAAGGAEAAVPPPGAEAVINPSVGISADTASVGLNPATNAGNIGITAGNVPQVGYTTPPTLTDRLAAGASNLYDKAASGISSLGDASTYTGMVDKAAAIPDRLTNVGQGIGNLLSSDPAVRAAAQEGFKSSGATLMNTAAPIMMGVTGTTAIDEMDKMKREQQMIIDEKERKRREAAERAYAAMTATPWRFADGGDISYDDSPGIDGLAAGGSPMIAKYAGGGQPRFLSGGGDGMSDSIPATIEGKQEARLADGEFVIPADVVSHLGNGSSKAGAKRLYSMMDKVRQARTGTTKQGKEINAMKYLPA